MIVTETANAIEITPDGLGVQTSAGMECLPQALSQLPLRETFPAGVTNHHGWITALENNHLHIYEGVRGVQFEEIGRVDLKHEGFVPTVFFDHNLIMPEPRVGAAVRNVEAVTVYLNDRLIGRYAPNTNTLLATDWTHDTESVEVLKAVWPQLKEKLALRVSRRSKAKARPKVTLGMDPELEVVDGYGEIACAEEVLNEEHCTTNSRAKIGIDGAGQQMELRPDPSERPSDLVKHMRAIAQDFQEYYPDFNWSTRGADMPIGGHIHIGVGFPVSPPRDLAVMFDHFLGIPLRAIGGSGRSGYGALSDFESKNWGFEYRTPPASYLAEPEMTRIVLKAAKGLTQTYMIADKVSYKKVPDAEDYKKVCGLTEKEFAHFRRFITEYPKMDKTHILDVWLGKKPKKEAKVARLVYEDTWDVRCQRVFDEALAAVLKKARLKFNVVLYGLRRSRGMVCTIPVTAPGCTVGTFDNPNPRMASGEALYIGIPHDLRHDVNYARAYSRFFADAIIGEVKKKQAAERKKRRAEKKASAGAAAVMTVTVDPVPADGA